MTVKAAPYNHPSSSLRRSQTMSFRRKPESRAKNPPDPVLQRDDRKRDDKQNVTRGWPPARRAAQALHCRRQKPWLCATGPKTREGKAVIARNAYRHGARSRSFTTLRRVLTQQRKFVKTVLVAEKANCFLPFLPVPESTNSRGWTYAIQTVNNFP